MSEQTPVSHPCSALYQPISTLTQNPRWCCSMSFTPTAGLPMSTRSGDLDPGLVWYLARTENMSAKQFNEMVNSQSGLLGVSETHSDIRDLLDLESRDVRAAEAVALFCYQVKKGIGAYAAALGSLDTLVFAGGIGENASVIRARICEDLAFFWNRTRRKAKRGECGRDFRSRRPGLRSTSCARTKN